MAACPATADLLPVHGPSVWTARDFAADHSWLHPLSEVQVDALHAALQAWRGRDFRDLAAVEAATRLASLVPTLQAARADLSTRGFALLRGVPVDTMTPDDAGLLYWAIGLLLGTGLTQNARADFLCPVTDRGVDFGYSGTASQRNVRGYQSNADLNYHCDPTDAVALLCVRQAKSGGFSALVSAPTVYNTLLREYPQHLAVLLRGFVYDRKAEEWPGEAPVTPCIPVFERHDGRVSCRYARSYILGGAQKQGRELDAGELAALDCFDAVARREGMALHMEFEPGDVQLVNNYTVLHGRTAYEDHQDPQQRRFLWRLWLHLGDDPPWAEESEAMRWAFARFGNLGRSLQEWRALDTRPA